MKYLKVLEPILPSGITVTSTTWEVRANSDMTGDVKMNVVEDTVNKFIIKTPFDMSDSDLFYAQITLHLSNGISEKSNILELRKNGNHKYNTLYVYPPIVSYDITGRVDKNLSISITEPRFYKNTGLHKSTTWRLKDTNGLAFYTREKDSDNLLSIIIDDTIFGGKKIFTIEAVYHFDIDDIEVFGRKNVSINPQEPLISLSKSRIVSNSKNTLQVLGYDTSISSLTATIIIGGVKKEPLLITSIHNTIIIEAYEVTDVNHVDIEFKISSISGVTTYNVGMPVINIPETNEKKLSKDVTVVTIPMTTMYDGGPTMFPMPLKDDSFALSVDVNGNKETTAYKINKNELTKINNPSTHFANMYISNELDLYIKDPLKIRKLDHVFEEAIDGAITISPSHKFGLSFTGNDIFYIDDDKKLNQIDIKSGISTILDIVDYTYDEAFYVNESIFLGSHTGVFSFRGIIETINGFDFVHYIESGEAVIAIGYKNDQVDIKYIRPFSIAHISTVKLVPGTGLPNIAYDVLKNKIYVVGKGL